MKLENAPKEKKEISVAGEELNRRLLIILR